MILLNDLKTQYLRLKDEINEEIINVLEGGQYVAGNKTVEFEQDFAEYLGVRYAISCASGTDALVLAFKAAGVGRGDEVITTPWAPLNTLEAIARVEGIPVFADIDPDTYNINPSCLEEKISCKSKVILCVHMFGQACEMDEIKEVAGKHKLCVIEDSCQAIGAEYKEKKTGSIGDIGCFSFSPDMNLSCCGNGGMVTTSDSKLATILLGLREGGSGWYGKQAAKYIHGNSDKKITEFESNKKINADAKHISYLFGYASRLDEVQAAILLIKLRYLDCWNEKRVRTAELYSREFSKLDLNIPLNAQNTKHIYSRYVLRSSKRDEYIIYLNTRGIEAKVCYPLPLHLQKSLKESEYKKGDFPIAEHMAETAFQIPVNSELTPDQKKYIAKIVQSNTNAFEDETMMI